MAIFFTADAHFGHANIPQTHNIRQLLQYANEQGVRLSVPEYIDDHAEAFSEWGDLSRYDLGFRLEPIRARKGYAASVEYFRAVATREEISL